MVPNCLQLCNYTGFTCGPIFQVPKVTKRDLHSLHCKSFERICLLDAPDFTLDVAQETCWLRLDTTAGLKVVIVSDVCN